MRDRSIVAAGAAFLVTAPVIVGLFAGVKPSNAALAIASGIVGGLGLAHGIRQLLRERADLRWRLRGVDVIQRSGLPDADKNDLCEQTLPVSSTWLDPLYQREVTRLYVLDQVAGNLAAIALAILGLAAATAASVWSVWI
ncbi:hypothetical protein ACFYNM_23015 [Streptomyces spororaveus]|uniref:hypothetical protein n=1 Tax=Streptomyces spororaveus TaxID=284039 RepID=UPI0036BD2687